MKNRKAFTLIELLVVIAIIALLLSIVLPSLQKAKDYAKRVICSNNMRQTGFGIKIYCDNNDDELIPLRKSNGKLGDETTTVLPWEAYLSYNPNYTDSNGDAIPMHLAVLYDLDLIDTPEVFYCPAQRDTDYPLKYNYKFYTEGGPWGTYFPSTSAGGSGLVRTSVNYWTHEKKRITELGGIKPIVVDCLQHWEVVPHRKGRSTETAPQGVSALFADGHVNFCKGADLFDKDNWYRNGTDFNQGPGNNKDLFLELLFMIQGKQ